MVDKRKLDCAVDESSADKQICKSDMTEWIYCEKSGDLHLAEPGLTVCWLAGCRADETQASFKF